MSLLLSNKKKSRWKEIKDEKRLRNEDTTNAEEILWDEGKIGMGTQVNQRHTQNTDSGSAAKKGGSHIHAWPSQ
jgi:hypothetical protein